MFSSTEYCFSSLTVIGILCARAYTISDARVVNSHSRTGAKISRSGANAATDTSKRT